MKTLKDVYKIEKFVTDKELRYIYETIGNIPDVDREKSIVNIGVYKGASVACILLAMKEFGITGGLHIVDVFKYSEANVHPTAIPLRERKDVDWSASFMQEAIDIVNEFREDQKVGLYRCFSDDVKLEEIGEISTIFIDGDHTTHACLLDLLKYSQILVSGGKILLHDSTWDTVMKAIKQFLLLRQDFDYLQETIDSILTLTKRREEECLMTG